METIFKKREIKLAPKYHQNTFFDCDIAQRGTVKVMRWNGIAAEAGDRYEIYDCGRKIFTTNDIEEVRKYVCGNEN